MQTTPAASTPAIRVANYDDAAAIASVHVRSWQYAYREMLPAEFLEKLSTQRRTAMWQESIDKGISSILVAVSDATIVGFIAFGPCRDEDAHPDDAEIWALYLAPEVLALGVGQQIWQSAKEQLHARRAASISLWVIADNLRAIRFYQKAGFLHQEGDAKTVNIGGMIVSELRYRQTLCT